MKCTRLNSGSTIARVYLCVSQYFVCIRASFTRMIVGRRILVKDVIMQIAMLRYATVHYGV
jgi:hypothetical protein